MIDLRLNSLDSIDLRGLPVIKKDKDRNPTQVEWVRPEFIEMQMASKTKNLSKLFQDILNNNKKPPKDENIWLLEPKMAFLYCKYFRKKRFSEEQERCFTTDLKALYHYVYWVVYSLGEKQPEHLHNFMLASSLSNESKEKEWADLYFKNIKSS